MVFIESMTTPGTKETPSMSDINYGQAEPVLTPAFPSTEFQQQVPADEVENIEPGDGELDETVTDPETESDDDYSNDDTADDSDTSVGRAATGAKTRNTGSGRQHARRIATKALALQSATPETRDLLKTLLGSSSDDAVSLTVDIMVGSPADARRVGNSLVALRTEFTENPVHGGFAIMELDRDALEQVWKLVHALGQDIAPRPPTATGKAVRPLAQAIGQISAQTVTLLTDALALTNRS